MQPTIGNAVKVCLPGETPWAECVAVNADGSWLGRIDNNLVCSDLHKLQLNDVVRFVPCPDAPNMPWMPALLAADQPPGDKAMTDDEKREQIAKQCEAIAHMATVLASVYSDYAKLFRDVPAHAVLTDQIGARTAEQMEVIGDMLNGMGAVDDSEDVWLNPVFRQAQILWPRPAHPNP